MQEVDLSYEANPALWLATQSGGLEQGVLELSYPLEITRWVPQEHFPEGHFLVFFIS